MKNQRLEKLILELKNGNSQQRRAASYKLGKSKSEKAIPALIHAYSDLDSSVRQNAIAGLRNIGTRDALDFLILEGLSINTSTTKKQIALPIILTSLFSAPFFDFLAPFIGVPFVGGGCGGMLISPLLALIISLITGLLGWIAIRFIVKQSKNTILIGLLCGFISGILAALIYGPYAC